MSGGKGAVVGLATAAASAAEVGAVAVGLVSGGVTAATDFAGNLVTHQQTSWADVAQDSVFNGLTGGAFEFLPGVPGRLPKLLSESFFTGAHAQNAYTQQMVGVTSQFILSNYIAPSIISSQSTHAYSTPLTVYQLTQQHGANIQSIISNWGALGSAVAQYNSGAAATKTK